MTAPEDTLIRRCRRGDRKARGELYETFGARVYRLARAILSQAADAEDATQEVFLRVFRHIGSYDGRGTLATWIAKITVNTCHSRSRPRGPRILDGQALADLDPEQAGPPVWERVAARELRERILERLPRLPASLREVLALRELEGLGYEQIAEVLEIPTGTVMSRLSRARLQLAGLLGLARWPGATTTNHKTVQP